MTLPRRLDPLHLDVAHDDELPDYEPTTAPEYTRGDYETPLHTYHLRRVDRKLQTFVPYGPVASTWYRVTTRGTRLFSKKPDSEIWRISGRDKREERISSIWFDDDGPLPWRPRAHFDHGAGQGKSTYAMESRNFTDWTLGAGDSTYLWTLGTRPISLELTETRSAEVIARFVFSGRGMTATGGADAGDLSVYHHALSGDRDGVEKIVSGLVVVLANFRKMGKYYWNEERDLPVRVGSLSGNSAVSHRGSVSTYASL